MAQQKDTTYQRAVWEQTMLETFHILDKDNSGCVTREEMKKAMQDNSVCEMTEKEMDAYFDRIDEDRSGKIDYREFVKFMSKEYTERELRQAFKQYDKNGDGVISVSELRDAMKNLGECISKKDAEEMIKAVDKDGNKKVDYEEFVKMMME